jgi:hypothetical protein
MAKIVRLTESDLVRLVKRIIKEESSGSWSKVVSSLKSKGISYGGTKFFVRSGFEGDENFGLILTDETPSPKPILKELWILNRPTNDYKISTRKYDRNKGSYETSGPVIEQGTWSWDGSTVVLNKN